jgi:hypothetical protein
MVLIIIKQLKIKFSIRRIDKYDRCGTEEGGRRSEAIVINTETDNSTVMAYPILSPQSVGILKTRMFRTPIKHRGISRVTVKYGCRLLKWISKLIGLYEISSSTVTAV